MALLRVLHSAFQLFLQFFNSRQGVRHICMALGFTKGGLDIGMDSKGNGNLWPGVCQGPMMVEWTWMTSAWSSLTTLARRGPAAATASPVVNDEERCVRSIVEFRRKKTGVVLSQCERRDVECGPGIHFPRRMPFNFQCMYTVGRRTCWSADKANNRSMMIRKWCKAV